MIQVKNYTIEYINLEVDDFRGQTCSMKLKQLLTDNEFTTVLCESGHTDRFAVFELNLSPTQSGPSASILGLTGFGLDIDYGQYRFDITQGGQLLETGLLWISGQNNTIY